GPKFLASRDRVVRERAMTLAVTFGDEKAVAAMTKTVADPTAAAPTRTTALHILLRRGKPDLLPILQQLVSDKDLRADAIGGLAALTAKYKAIRTEGALNKADPFKGRLVFVKNCAACHKLYDEGGDVGPALTGSQRSNLDYVLENVLDPSAVDPREYQVNVIELQNGRVINGIIKAETDKALTVRTANETI